MVLLLLRLTLDVSLAADYMVSSELQWTINAVLDPDNFTGIDVENLVSLTLMSTFAMTKANGTSCIECALLALIQ